MNPTSQAPDLTDVLNQLARAMRDVGRDLAVEIRRNEAVGRPGPEADLPHACTLARNRARISESWWRRRLFEAELESKFGRTPEAVAAGLEAYDEARRRIPKAALR